MKFEWSETKRRQVIEERGVDLLYAALIFEGDVLTRRDKRNTARNDGSPLAWWKTNVSSWFTPSGKVRRV